MSNTIRTLVQNLSRRTGPSHGLNRKGAYWVVLSVDVRKYREEGEDVRTIHTLELRHYRDGDVAAVLVRRKEEEGAESFSKGVPAIVDATNVEDVIVALLGETFKNGESNAYSTKSKERLTAALTSIGLELAPVGGPDDVPAPSRNPVQARRAYHYAG